MIIRLLLLVLLLSYLSWFVSKYLLKKNFLFAQIFLFVLLATFFVSGVLLVLSHFIEGG